MEMTADVAAPVALVREPPPPPVVQVALPLYAMLSLLAAGIGGLLSNDPLGFIAIIVLAVGWRLLREEEGPPALRFVFLYQWVQVTIGVFYFGLTHRYSLTVSGSDYRRMVWIGLGTVGALFGGVAVCMHLMRVINPRPPRRLPGGLSNREVTILYLLALITSASMIQVGSRFPGIYQIATVLTYFRYALMYIAFYRLSTPRFQWKLFAPLLLFEVLLGFTGFFADFREPIIFALFALLQIYDIRKVRHTVIVTTVGALVLVVAVVWTAIKPEYRSAYNEKTGSRAQRITLVRVLTSRMINNGSDELLRGADMTVDRLWAVYYPALAIERVPSVLPHTDGENMWTGIRHTITPRLFFPNKPPLESNSQKVRKYTGLNVAGEEQGTSIAFGYSPEMYIDFGVPLMFLPIFVAGFTLYLAFRRVQRMIRHQDLAVAVTACIIWFSIYQFEQAWARMLGISLTLLIGLGSVGFAIDRYLMFKRRAAASIARPRVA